MKLSEKVKVAVMAGVLAIAGAGAALIPASAAPGAVSNGLNSLQNEFGNTTNADTVVKSVINTILYVVGILAVVMIIMGGIQYTTSAGDQAKVTKAKNTILYGIVGLVIAVLAYAIVNFVLSKL
ncbi:hypothetical protein IJ380_02265 [Candidatus Saccharibacteria bacterium]|nr:hypothetical protein [Candidatus Saccharibacteria bacterium]